MSTTSPHLRSRRSANLATLREPFRTGLGSLAAVRERGQSQVRPPNGNVLVPEMTAP